MQQIAVEGSLRLYFKVLWNKRPVNIFESIFDEENDRPLKLTKEQLEKMTKIGRKSWRIRVLRYGKIMPEEFYDMDPMSFSFKSHLKEWIKSFIRGDGDDIMNGKAKGKVSNDDWLRKEVTDWRYKQKHDEESITQLQKLEDENGKERMHWKIESFNNLPYTFWESLSMV